MTYTTTSKVRLISNLTTTDITDADVTSLIAESTKELNRMINVKETRENVYYIDSTRKNKIDGVNTTYYVQNWKGKYFADGDDDGDVDTDDITVYIIDSDGTESVATVSSIDVGDSYFVLSTAPIPGQRIEVSYEWCYKNPSTPDKLIELACTYLTVAYCYAKINFGRAPQVSFGNKRIYRHMEAFDLYYRRFLDMVNLINQNMYEVEDSLEVI